MEDLATQTCIACQGGIPPMTPHDVAVFMKKLDTEAPGWQVVDSHHLLRKWQFKDFSETWAFVQKIAALAEEQQHHPDIKFSFDYCEVTIFTHKIDGLHESDFILAAKISQIT